MSKIKKLAENCLKDADAIISVSRLECKVNPSCKGLVALIKSYDISRRKLINELGKPEFSDE
jgi:hypothetical protein